MASLYRPVTCALLDVTPRKVVSASFSHSAILSSASILSNKPFESVSEIFDIFDAPVKLQGRITPYEPLKVLDSPSITYAISRASFSRSRRMCGDALGLPWSLPPPVTFDGPACPPHMSPLTLKKRRQQRRNSSHSAGGVHGSCTVSCSAFTLAQSKPLYQLFDGPSRITCYQYPASQNEVCNSIPFIISSLSDCLVH